MVTLARTRRQERSAERALARAALYQLLSQATAYPSRETVRALALEDVPRARQAAPSLPEEVARHLTALDRSLEDTDADQLQAAHRRVFTHVLSLDCPPCETFYTARHLFQETEELSDIAGFFRAFGLEMADKQRLDHISVELEFMQFLTYKEAYAILHHGPAKARFCRTVQRKFMEEHLGRWALQFAELLRRKAGGGYFGCVASLAEALVTAEIGFLRARPEAYTVNPSWRTKGSEEFECPAGGGCPDVGSGGDDAHEC